jgi:Sulfotransferase domain
VSAAPSRVARRLGDLDLHARRRLPKPLYRSLARGYYGTRRLAGRSPGRGRLAPDFVVIGAAKAGTTSLFAWLGEHPYVVPACKKEVHFFDYNYFRGEGWYRAHFPSRSERERFAAVRGRPFLTGEASPSYLSHHWAPERLARTLPDARLLVSLRNPIERAYSQYQMSIREQEEPLASFAEAIAAEERRLAPERERMLADRWYNSWPTGCWSYLMRSRYAEQLERWMRFFAREQFHFLTLEQLAADPQGTLDGVHEFLGLPAHRYAELAPAHVAPRYDTIGAAERAALADYFKPHNQRLYELVGADFGWDREQQPRVTAGERRENVPAP